jgi:hypothetical protein
MIILDVQQNSSLIANAVLGTVSLLEYIDKGMCIDKYMAFGH